MVTLVYFSGFDVLFFRGALFLAKPVVQDFARANSGRELLVEHVLGTGGTIFLQPFVERGVRGGQDFRGEQSGVGCAGLADGERADGDALRHLHDGEQRVLAVQNSGGHGDAEDRHECFGGEHAGEVRGSACAGDDDAEATVAGGFGVLEHEVRRAVRANDFGFVRDFEFFEDVDGGGEDVVVAFAAHNYADKRAD